MQDYFHSLGDSLFSFHMENDGLTQISGDGNFVQDRDRQVGAGEI